MRKVVAMEEGLSQSIRSALEKEGYMVVRPGRGVAVDATIITGMDRNVMGMEDMAGKSVVIDAAGKTPAEVLSDLKGRLE